MISLAEPRRKETGKERKRILPLNLPAAYVWEVSKDTQMSYTHTEKKTTL